MLVLRWLRGHHACADAKGAGGPDGGIGPKAGNFSLAQMFRYRKNVWSSFSAIVAPN